jgi:hypothetical protein
MPFPSQARAIPSYIMNALDVLASFEEVNRKLKSRTTVRINVPKLSIVSGASMAIEVNNYDEISANRHAERIFSFLNQFVHRFYPDVHKYLAFEHPTCGQVFDNPLYELLLDASQELTNPDLAKRICPIANVACPNTRDKSREFQAILDKLEKNARNRMDSSQHGKDVKQGALRYAVAQLMPDIFCWVQQSGRSTLPVWTIGGAREKDFNKFSEILSSFIQHKTSIYLPNNGTQYGTCGLRTPTTVGSNPPYYRGPEDTYDLGLSEYKAGPWEGTFSDAHILERIENEKSGPASDMRALLRHPRLGKNNVRLGWDKYSNFLSTCKI